MSDPRNDPLPKDSVGQVRAFARDLAYGALQGDWSAKFAMHYGDGRFGTDDWAVKNYLAQKWDSNPPNLYLLVSFGYLQDQRREVQAPPNFKAPMPTIWEFLLTDKAFALLEQPTSTSVFISYRRGESSAFALLVLARFQMIGLEPFLDLNIEPGNEWHAQLEQEINRRDYFVILVGPATLDSEFVREEIIWALASKARIIPIWHNGCDDHVLAEMQDRYPELGAFFDKQAIKVEQENPVAYEGAITQLLNRFGITS
jgi:hypothetical protein